VTASPSSYGFCISWPHSGACYRFWVDGVCVTWTQQTKDIGYSGEESEGTGLRHHPSDRTRFGRKRCCVRRGCGQTSMTKYDERSWCWAGSHPSARHQHALYIPSGPSKVFFNSNCSKARPASFPNLVRCRCTFNLTGVSHCPPSMIMKFVTRTVPEGRVLNQRHGWSLGLERRPADDANLLIRYIAGPCVQRPKKVS
jgi:hypothetical protein